MTARRTWATTSRKGDFRFTLATDVGHVTDDIADYIGRADHVVLEANYDPRDATQWELS